MRSINSMRIGSNTNIEAAFNSIELKGAVPVLEYKGYVYLIHPEFRTRGITKYTKFNPNMTDVIHSVALPYSKAHTVGEIIDRGEGLHNKQPPFATVLPALAFAVIECKDKPTIIINNT
jgi:hypothetical protein